MVNILKKLKYSILMVLLSIIPLKVSMANSLVINQSCKASNGEATACFSLTPTDKCNSYQQGATLTCEATGKIVMFMDVAPIKYWLLTSGESFFCSSLPNEGIVNRGKWVAQDGDKKIWRCEAK